MYRAELIQLAGNELPCRSGCRIGYQCLGGWINENPDCDSGIYNLMNRLRNPDVEVLHLKGSNGVHAIRVLDGNSSKNPLPEIVTIDIVEGNLFPR